MLVGLLSYFVGYIPIIRVVAISPLCLVSILRVKLMVVVVPSSVLIVFDHSIHVALALFFRLTVRIVWLAAHILIR